MRFKLPIRFATLRVARLACSIGFVCLAGCSQGLGDECQEDTDCSGSLVCDINAKGSARGVCQDRSKISHPTPTDASSPSLDEDSGASESVVDAGPGDGDAG